MSTPFWQSFVSDGSSGTTPTSITDVGPATTVPLTMTFGGTAAWGTAGTGKYLSFDATGSSQAASATLSGSKIQTAVSGATAMVVELVGDSSGSNGCFASLADNTNANQTFAIVVNSSGAQIDIFVVNGWYRWLTSVTTRCVLHLDIDTTRSAGDRARLYKNGSLVTLNTVVGEITASAALDASNTNWGRNVLYLGGESGAIGGVYLTGTVRYLALYSSLTTIAANATNLLANDDVDPNSGAAPTPVLLRRREVPQPPPDPVFYFMGMKGIIPDAGAPSVLPPFARRWLSAVLAAWEPEPPPPPRPRTGAPVIPAPPAAPSPVFGLRRWLTNAIASWLPVYPEPVRRPLVFPVSGPDPTPPTPPIPAPTPGANALGNQTTGEYDPNIALAFLLSVQDPTGATVAMNTFVSVASPFNDYALTTAGLLGPVRAASGRDLSLVKNIAGNARRIGQSNTPDGSIVQYPHLIGATGLSFQQVGLMDVSGATYANVQSAAQTGGIYRQQPKAYPNNKAG